LGILAANPITVSNFSFENLNGPLMNTDCGVACAYNMNGMIPDWNVQTTPGKNSGQWQPGSSSGNTLYLDYVPNGTTVAYSDSGTISQSVGNISAANLLYTLLVDVGLRKDPGAALGQVALIIDSMPIMASVVGAAPVAGGFSTYMATFTSSVTDIGKPIVIQLSSTAYQGVFDNVRLFDSAPEPATTVLVGCGIAAVALLARRRRAAAKS
jgi:hypothetical protein